MKKSLKKWWLLIFIFICLVLFLILRNMSCSTTNNYDYDYSQMKFEFFDTNGNSAKRTESIETGESLSVGFSGLEEGAPVEVFLNDEDGKEWSYARLFANREGVIDPTLFWYHTGVIGKTSRQIDFKPDPSFLTFEEAENYFLKKSLILSVKDLNGKIHLSKSLPFKPSQKAMVYPSDKSGILYNAFDLQKEDMYVTGKNFPKGSTVQLFLVPNQHIWNEGDAIKDISGKDQTAKIETIKLGSNETSFTVKIQDKQFGRPGAYDIISRIGDDIIDLNLHKNDIISYAEDTGVLYYIIIAGNIVIESAGRMKSGPAKFEFSDAFEKGEDVYAAVDPTDVPAIHPGGNYAAYYVVEDQVESYWDGILPSLTDISGASEIKRVKYWCINATRALVWPSATQTEPMKGYDVIVDFGSTAAMNAADYVADNTYNKGVDFIDGYNTEGFWVYEDPSSTGPFAVGEVILNEPNGITGITDPAGINGPTYSMNLAWAKIMYPADSPGSGVPVSSVNSNYPIALFMHGRHMNCDNDGAGPGLSGSYTQPDVSPCAVANRIPSHEGYDYIMERLASQGIFCISISTHDVQAFGGPWNYFARGKLALKFLDKLRDWNNSGSDPFAGIFNGKLDMSKIALSGHSRGGEGVVVAQDLNLTWPIPHSILAVSAIAPTDQDANVKYNMTDAPYYLIMGARDGDVSNMQGFRTYDRSFRTVGASTEDKMVSWIYGANHNYFNTVWTETASLGSPNPWAGSTDEGISGAASLITATEQRQIALTTTCAFFRRYLQGIDPYKEIFTGRVKPNAMRNDVVYWTYQDKNRRAVDNFEQLPLNENINTLLGSVNAPAFSTFEERLLNNGATAYTGTFTSSRDATFFHDALGLKLSWLSNNTYETNLPAGSRDVSAFSHLSFRAAKKDTGTPTSTGTPVNLMINVEDGTGNKALWDLRTDQFDIIPHPYNRGFSSNQSLMSGVRIPLRNFTMNNSGVDLTDLRKIIITSTGIAEIGLDDIEFSN